MEELRKEAAKPMTTVLDCVSTFDHLKSLHIAKETSRQFPTIFRMSKLDIFVGKIGQLLL